MVADRWTFLIVGALLGGMLGMFRVKGTGQYHPDAPLVATPLGYDQHNAGYENHSPLAVGAAYGYLGIIPSGA